MSTGTGLNLFSVSTDDSGVYQCTAESFRGDISARATLTVLCKYVAESGCCSACTYELVVGSVCIMAMKRVCIPIKLMWSGIQTGLLPALKVLLLLFLHIHCSCN